MMGSQIIQYQKHLAWAVFYQSAHEFDQCLGVHGFFIKHKAHFALIGDRGDHADPFTLGRYVNRRGFTRWSDGADTVAFRIEMSAQVPFFNSA